MTFTKQIIFDEGCNQLMKGNFVGFAESVTEVYTKYSLCECFFEEQVETIWPLLLAKILEIEVKDEWSDFDMNLSKGFLFIRNSMHSEAYYHLTRVININPLFDTAYNIRSCISEKYNKKCMQDATEAVILRSSATNYFALANIVRFCDNLNVGGAVIEDGEEITCEIFDLPIKKAIHLYDKALEQDDSFSCAYARKGGMYSRLKEYGAAADSYTLSLKIKPNYWAWDGLWDCIDALDYTSRDIFRYNEMIELLESAAKSNVKNQNLYLELAIVNERIGNYKKAIEYNKIYLDFFPVSVKSTARSSEFSKKLSSNSDSYGLKLARKGLFSDALFCFDVYLVKYEFSTLELADTYLKVLLKVNNNFVDISEDNPFFVKMQLLRVGCSEKIASNIEPTADEIDAKLMRVYGLDSEINFGEYSGYLVKDVMLENPLYLISCIINWKRFALHNSAIINKVFWDSESYIKAVELNLIKNIIIGQWESEMEDEKEANKFDYSNYSWEEETFDALTDGQLGDWEDFGGDIDDARTSMGLD